MSTIERAQQQHTPHFEQAMHCRHFSIANLLHLFCFALFSIFPLFSLFFSRLNDDLRLAMPLVPVALIDAALLINQI